MTPMLRLYNTLTREKAAFVPIDPANVRMYACGPTVYDAAHIGNARPIIVFDLLFRLLRHRYGPDHVTYARNVTDVDDKINARALERGITIRELTDGTLAQFHRDIRDLGVLMGDDVNLPGEPSRFIEPRATDHIEEMHRLIEGLVAAGHAYVAEGHVLFDVPSMPDYGALSKRPLDEMEAGARVEVAPYKRSPLDFVLWKPSKAGEPSWPSPCGIEVSGRPGWHIECSAMSWKHLGQTFDIHAGGLDLIFPHHENEVAQSRCCFGTDVMANVWLHNGFLQVEGEKMSKSLGNFITLRQVLDDWPGEVVRLNMLKTHYRQPIDWTLRGLVESQKLWSKWVNLNNVITSIPPDADCVAALCDDLNTPEFIKRLDGIAERARKDDEQSLEIFAATARYFGFLTSEPTTFFFPAAGFNADPAEELQKLLKNLPSSLTVHNLKNFLIKHNLTPSNGFPDLLSLLKLPAPDMSLWDLKGKVGKINDIAVCINERAAARANKDWAASDEARFALSKMGVSVKDNKNGETNWSVVREP